MAIDFGKKIAGVPVVYLGAGAAAILGVVAWRMKTAAEPTADTGEDATLDENGLADGSDPYAGYNGNGTVIVAPTPTPEPVEPDRPDTNDEWIREGAEWLVSTKSVSGTAAYTALSKYVDGKSRSIQEAQWVEWVIKEKGFPPDTFTDTPLPPVSTPPTAPKPTPIGPVPGSKRGYGWYQVKRGDSAAYIARKYGISVNTFYAFNGKDALRTGEWVKVRAGSNPTYGYNGK